MLTAFHLEQQQSDYALEPIRHAQLDFMVKGTQQVLSRLARIDCRNLETLNLSHTSLDDTIIDPIINAFINKEGTQLTELNLSGNQLSDQGVERLLTAIDASPHCQLRTLNITGNPQVSASVHDKVIVFSSTVKRATQNGCI